MVSNNKIIEGQASDENTIIKIRINYSEHINHNLYNSEIREEFIELEIDNNIVVKELKKIISYNGDIEIPIDRMMLTYNDDVLSDDKILTDYDIKEGSIINLGDNIQISEYDTYYDVLRRELNERLYGEDDIKDPYKMYLKEFLNFNKLKNVKSDRKYSQRLSDLLMNKSKPFLKPANKFHYLDDNLNNKLKEDSIEIVGPNGYIDSPELYDRIIQEQVSDNNEIINKDKKQCCTRSGLNIYNPKLINDPNMKMEMFKRDLIYESQGDFEEKNRNYFDYMEDDDNIFDSLNGSMRNFTNPGKLTV